ncbi:MAG: DUF2336 domain-containing protein [Stappiaceae bacterium]
MTRFQNPDGVVALVQATDKTRKAQLLIAAAELYASAPAHDFSDKKIFAELFRNLVIDAPSDSRKRVALLLAHCDNTPEDVLISLARDRDPNVAFPVLCHAKSLCERELIAAIGRGPDTLRRAIAMRHDLTPNTLAALELYTSETTGLENTHGYPVQKKPRPVPSNDDLPLGATQPRATRETLLTLERFLAYDGVQRLHALASAEARTLISKSIQQSGKFERTSLKPLSSQDALRLERIAMSGDRAAFANVLAGQLELDAASAKDIVFDVGGEALLVCLKYLGLPGGTVNTILVRLWTAAKTLKNLRILSDVYDRLTPETAMQMMSGWRSDRQAGKHQPLHEDTERHISLRTRDVANRPAEKVAHASNHTISVTRVTR